MYLFEFQIYGDFLTESFKLCLKMSTKDICKVTSVIPLHERVNWHQHQQIQILPFMEILHIMVQLMRRAQRNKRNRHFSHVLLSAVDWKKN